jgi:hypothetical protein
MLILPLKPIRALRKHAKPEVRMPDEKLKDYFKFDETDLQANQGGHFSEKQKDVLAAMDTSDNMWRRIGGVGCLVVALAGLTGALWLISTNDNLIMKIVFGAGFGLLWPLVWGGIGVFQLRSPGSKRKYKLGRAQGPVSYTRHIDTHTGVKVLGYWLMHVATMRFYMPEGFPDLMLAGDEYLVFYYTRDGLSKIVSVEKIAPAA